MRSRTPAPTRASSAATDAPLPCQELSRIEELTQIRESWNRLVLASEGRPYARAEWLRAWWHGFGAGATLKLLLVWEGDVLVAGVPLMASRRTASRLPVRAIHSTGLNIGSAGFVTAGSPEGAMRAVLDHLRRTGGWDVLIVGGILLGGAQEQALRKLLAERRLPYLVHERPEMFLHIAAGIEEYRRARSKKLWSNLRNRRRRLERVGAVKAVRHVGADFAPALTEAFDVSLRSWKARSGGAIGLKETFRTFVSLLMEDFAPAGAAELWTLRVSGRAVAYRIGFLHGRTFVECEIAYDERYRAYSPGTLLSAESNEDLIERGVTEIDLGMAFDWKREWNPEQRDLLEFHIYHPRRLYARALLRLGALRASFERFIAGRNRLRYNR